MEEKRGTTELTQIIPGVVATKYAPFNHNERRKIDNVTFSVPFGVRSKQRIYDSPVGTLLGNHYHPRKEELFQIEGGVTALVEDIKTKERGRVDTSPDDPITLVYVPANKAHALRVDDENTLIQVDSSLPPHEILPGDTNSYDLTDKF